ncbi:MAG: hypothetical protein GC137_08765 [Alphaproteobacteria bacterium]|nr:hypothetical protein [Alphaproteobacteria bacterium]
MRSDFAKASGSYLFGGALIAALVGFPTGSALLGLIAGSVTAVGSYLADSIQPVAQKLEKANTINQNLPSVG